MNNAGTVRYVITADNEKFIEQLAAAGKALSSFAEQIDGVNKEVGNLGSGKTISSTDSFTSSIAKSAQQLGNFTSALSRVGWNAFTTAAGTASATLIKFASGAVTDTQFLENTQIQMQGLTHSIEDGNKAMAYATQYFKNNPFNRFDVTDATKQLIQYGAQLDDIPKLLDKMGKVSLSTGVEINTLSRIYQSAMSNGRISTGDINMLAERGIPIWKALGDVTGKTNAEIRKDLETGKLAIQDFQKAFDLLVDDNAMEQFNNTFSRQLDRFKGRLSNMRAAIAGYSMDLEKGLQVDPNGLYRSVTEILKVFANTFDYGVGKQFLESLTRLGNGLAWVIDKVMGFYEITVKTADGTEKVVRMSKTLDAFFGGLGKIIDVLTNNMELMLPIGIGALSMFGGLLSRIPVFGQILGPVSTSVKQLTSAFGKLNTPMKIFVAILGAGAFKALREGKLNEPLQKIWNSIKKISETLAPVVKRLVEIGSVLGEKVIVFSLNSIASILGVISDVLSKIPTEVLVKLVEGFLAFKAVKSVSGPLGDFLTKLHQTKSVVMSIIHGGAEGGSIIGQFKKVLGKDSELSSISDTIKKTGDIGDTLQVSAQKLAQAQQKTQNMRESLKNIAILVAIVAELGLAIGIADRMIQSDFKTLMGKLGAMAIAIIGMGLIAKAAEKVKIKKNSLVSLAGLAADIGALGFALGVADRMIVSNFGTLMSKLGAMAIAVVGMGLVAKAAEAIKIGASGILVIVGLAADIALLGKAMGIVDKEIQSDFKTLMSKLGAMGVAILEFGVLSAAIGAVMDTGIGAIVIGSGIATILGFAGAIASIALAIGEIDKNVPSNIKTVKNKISAISECLEAMASTTWVNPVKNFIKMIDTRVLAEIAEIYVKVASSLRELERITLNKRLIESKVQLITECLDIISNDRGNTSIVQMFKTTISQFLGKVDVNTLSDVVKTYVNIAKSLNELQSIDLKTWKIKSSVIFIKDTIEFIASTRQDSVGNAMVTTVNNFLNNVDIHLVEEIVSIYNSIAWKLNQIQNIEINAKDISQKVMFIAETIRYVTFSDYTTLFGTLSKTAKDKVFVESVKSAETILQIFSNLSGTLSKIRDISFDESTKATILTNIRNIQSIIAAIFGQSGGGGFAGFLRSALLGKPITPEEVQTAVNILDKFKLLSDKFSSISKITIPKNLETQIGEIQKIITAISSVTGIPSIKSKVDTVEGTESIFNAMKAISSQISEIKSLPEDAQKNVEGIRDLIYQIGQINQVKGIENKEYIVHMSQSILNAMSEMSSTANEMSALDSKTKDNVIEVRNLIYEIGNVWQADDIDNKEHIVQVSKSILETMRSFAEVANTMPQLQEEKLGFISSIKTSINNLSSLPDESYDGKLSTVTSARQIIDELVGISNSMAGFNKDGINNGLLGQLITIINTELNSLISNLANYNNSFYSLGSSFAGNMITGFSDSNPGNEITSSISTIIESISTKTKNFLDVGISYASSFKTGISSIDFMTLGKTLGQNTTIGFAEGLKTEVWRINLAAGILSNTAINKLKSLLGIASPSKVMYEIGSYTGQGLVEGILSTEDSLKKAMTEITNDIQNPLDSLSSESLNLAGLGSQEYGLGSSRTNNLTMNNNIYTQFDIDQMGRDIMWNMERY